MDIQHPILIIIYANNMKRYIILLLFPLLCVSLYAQLPDWTRNKPTPGNYTMDYEVGIGEGDTYAEAQNAAYIEIMKKLISRCRLSVSSSEIMRAVYEGKSFTTINKDYNLPPIREVCMHQILLKSGKIRVYLLYQVPFDGSITSPRYETFNDCEKIDHGRDNKALVASTFIPGLGQMLKGQGGSGAAFLISELALFGGGTACYFLGQDQLRTMKAIGTSYNDYINAKKTKNICDIAMYTCFGVGVAVHVGNMIHAWCVKDKHISDNLTFVPAINNIGRL